MHEQDNPLKTVELSTEQNYNARVFAYQNRGAGHSVMVSFLCCGHAPTGGSWTTKSD